MDKQTILSHFTGDFLPFFEHYLPDVQKNGQGHKACCPFHQDSDPSMSIDAGTGKFFCHGCNAQGDILTFYSKMKDLNIKTEFGKILDGIAEEFGITSKDQPMKLVKTYDYRDEAGNLLYQVLRFEPKTFRQRRPDGNGGWIYSMKGARRVLFQLDDLVKAQGAMFVEGEKDALSLGELGYMATTSPGGAGNLVPPEEFEVLRGKEVVLCPDNDEPGRQHMKKVAAILQGIAGSIKWLDLPGLPEKGDVSDWIAQAGPKAGEPLESLLAAASVYNAGDEQPDEGRGLKIISASSWLETEPRESDQIIEGVIDAGDKAALIGGSKTRKTFLLLMMLLCLAAGRSFLNFRIPKPRKVLLCQLEIRDHHYHRRVKRMARALGITPEDLGDRFQIINGRGLGISGPEGIARIMDEALKVGAEVVAFDPLYKISEGNENDKADQKKALDAFDIGAEKTGAAIMYVHHDAKGSPGDRDIRDRGAGSNVLGRDYDACITLTAHAQDPDAAIIELLLRNYPPQDPFTIMWTQEESGGYCFEVRPDLLPEKKTSKTKAPQPPLTIYLPISETILGEEEMEIAAFKDELKTRSSLSDHRIREFLRWATSGDDPYIITTGYRAYGLNKKWVKIGRRVNDGK